MKSALSYLPVLLACAFVGLMAGIRHGGVMLVFIAPIFLLSMLVACFKAWKRPERRRPLAISAGLWMLTIALIVGLHWHYYTASRKAADAVVASVAQYMQTHGKPPADAQTLGFTNGKNEWRIFYTLRADQIPSVIYFSTFMPFDTWEYEFDNKRWIYRSD